MRSPRHRWGVIALVGGLAAGGTGAAIAVSAGADPPSGPPGGGTANMPAVIAAKLSAMNVPGLGRLSVENDSLANGDHLMTYLVNGHGMVKLRDRAACLGESRGMAQITQPSPGVWEITGVAAKGAQGLVITLQDGTVVQPPLDSPGSGDYPFFDVQVSSPPVGFNTTGVAMPQGCAPPDAGGS